MGASIHTAHAGAKGLDMKPDRGLHIDKSIFVRITLPHDHAFEANGVRDISVRVLLNDDL